MFSEVSEKPILIQRCLAQERVLRSENRGIILTYSIIPYPTLPYPAIPTTAVDPHSSSGVFSRAHHGILSP